MGRFPALFLGVKDAEYFTSQRRGGNTAHSSVFEKGDNCYLRIVPAAEPHKPGMILDGQVFLHFLSPVIADDLDRSRLAADIDSRNSRIVAGARVIHRSPHPVLDALEGVRRDRQLQDTFKRIKDGMWGSVKNS